LVEIKDEGRIQDFLGILRKFQLAFLSLRQNASKNVGSINLISNLSIVTDHHVWQIPPTQNNQSLSIQDLRKFSRIFGQKGEEVLHGEAGKNALP